MRRAARRTRQFPGHFLGSLGCLLAFVGCVDTASTALPKPPTPSPKPAPVAPRRSWLVESFESPQGTSGGFWCAFDHNGLGTQVSPDPFVLTPGGAPPS